MLYVVKNTDNTSLKKSINASLSLSFKNKCDNTTAENNFGVITENVPCGSTGTTCSKTVRVQLGVSEKDVGVISPTAYLCFYYIAKHKHKSPCY